LRPKLKLQAKKWYHASIATLVTPISRKKERWIKRFNIYIRQRALTSLDAATEFKYSFDKRPGKMFQYYFRVSATGSTEKISPHRLR